MNTGTKHITEDFSKLRRVLKNQSIRCAVFIYFHAINKKTDETTKPISKANKLLKPAQPIEQSKKASVSCRGAEKLTNGCQKRFIMQPALWNSTLMRRFSALDRIYARIEDSQQYFKQASTQAGNPIACPRRCGTCCIHFTPDVTALEAERLALYLLVEKRDLIDPFLGRIEESEKAGETWDSDKACPFWNPDKPGENCMVYPGRALVCRLFGYCAVLDKKGRPSFALCDKMPPLADRGERIFTGEETLRGLFGQRPPLMDEFSREILALDPSGAGERRSIIEALPAALSKISLLLRLAESDSDSKGALPAAEPGFGLSSTTPSAEADSDPDDFPIAS